MHQNSIWTICSPSRSALQGASLSSATKKPTSPSARGRRILFGRLHSPPLQSSQPKNFLGGSQGSLPLVDVSRNIHAQLEAQCDVIFVAATVNDGLWSGDIKRTALAMFQTFGEYLVQQGILSSNHYRHLLDQQSQAVLPVGTFAIRRNMMTIKQVALVLEYLETNPQRKFLDVAQQFDFLDAADADQLRRELEQQAPGLDQVLIAMQTMTEQQAAVLRQHYQRLQNDAAAVGSGTEAAKPATPTETASSAAGKPPAPKFRQRPIQVLKLTPVSPRTNELRAEGQPANLK